MSCNGDNRSVTARDITGSSVVTGDMNIVKTRMTQYDAQHNKEILVKLNDWFSKLSLEEVRKGQFNAAIDSVYDAILATIKYQKRVKESNAPDEKSEIELSDLWNQASLKIREHDPQLSYYCSVKSQGWLDQEMWERKDYKEAPIRLEEMTEHLRKLVKSKQEKKATEQKQKEALEREMAERQSAVERIRVGSAFMIATVSLLTFLGIAFILGGVLLVYLQATGEAEIRLFGNTFKSANAGVASIFCGAVVTILCIRRLIRAVEKISR